MEKKLKWSALKQLILNANYDSDINMHDGEGILKSIEDLQLLDPEKVELDEVSE